MNQFRDVAFARLADPGGFWDTILPHLTIGHDNNAFGQGFHGLQFFHVPGNIGSHFNRARYVNNLSEVRVYSCLAHMFFPSDYNSKDDRPSPTFTVERFSASSRRSSFFSHFRVDTQWYSPEAPNPQGCNNCQAEAAKPAHQDRRVFMHCSFHPGPPCENWIDCCGCHNTAKVGCNKPTANAASRAAARVRGMPGTSASTPINLDPVLGSSKDLAINISPSSVNSSRAARSSSHSDLTAIPPLAFDSSGIAGSSDLPSGNVMGMPASTSPVAPRTLFGLQRPPPLLQQGRQPLRGQPVDIPVTGSADHTTWAPYWPIVNPLPPSSNTNVEPHCSNLTLRPEHFPKGPPTQGGLPAVDRWGRSWWWPGNGGYFSWTLRGQVALLLPADGASGRDIDGYLQRAPGYLPHQRYLQWNPFDNVNPPPLSAEDAAYFEAGTYRLVDPTTDPDPVAGHGSYDILDISSSQPSSPQSQNSLPLTNAHSNIIDLGSPSDHSNLIDLGSPSDHSNLIDLGSPSELSPSQDRMSIEPLTPSLNTNEAVQFRRFFSRGYNSPLPMSALAVKENFLLGTQVFRLLRRASGRMVAQDTTNPNPNNLPQSVLARWAGAPPSQATTLLPIDFPVGKLPPPGGRASLDAWGHWVVRSRSGNRLLYVDHPNLTYDIATEAASSQWGRRHSIESRVSSMDLDIDTPHRHQSSSAALPPGLVGQSFHAPSQEGGRLPASTSMGSMESIQEEETT